MAKITLQNVFDEVIRLSELIDGDPNDRHDDGILGDVKENTVFRKSMNKFFWLLVAMLLMGNTPIIFYGSKVLVEKLQGGM